MLWNWELPNWPHFQCDFHRILPQERQFLQGVGGEFAFLKNLASQEKYQFVVEILTTEGIESSKIEGEILDRESMQSSIRKHFGLSDDRRSKGKEAGMAQLLCNVYDTFNAPLTHEMLWLWHAMLFDDSSKIDDRGRYRTHADPMQIVSHRYGSPKVFFEAPPSAIVSEEMDVFIDWFNASKPEESILGRAAVAHLYFESIHPFEDGNGRIGRALVEKILSQGVSRPVLIAISKILESRKKAYYSALERCNHTLEIQNWIEFFADVVLESQNESFKLLHFLIQKAKLFKQFAGELNLRQEKVLKRMFLMGPEGFTGGLSAEKYIAITKASRATATRDLADLMEKGILVKTGELRHTRYWLHM